MDEKKVKILIVDDEAAIHDAYREMLASDAPEIKGLNDLMGVQDAADESLNLDITFRFQGIDAVNVVKEASNQGIPFTHVLLDMRMPPGIDGLEAAVRIREIDPDIKIAFVTAYSDYTQEEILDAMASRFVLIGKPFTKEQILDFLAYG